MENIVLLRMLTLIVLISLCISPGLLAESQKELIDKTLSNHRAAQESIHTFYCRVSISSKSERSVSLPTGQYWRTPDTVRIHSQKDNTIEDILVESSKVTSIVKERTSRGESARASVFRVNQPLATCDVWRMALFTFFGPEGGWITLDELLKSQSKLKTIKRQSESGKELIYIDLDHDKAKVEIWLDSHVNYLARKMRITMNLPGSRVWGEHEILRFKEVVDGIFFPEEIEARSYTDNKLDGTTFTTISDVKINQPLGQDVFKLRYPAGVQIMDTIEGKMYIANQEGRPIGTVKNMQVVRTPPLPVDGGSQTATEFEPKSLTRWILPASFGLVIVGGAIWFIQRKWRKRPC